MHHDTISTLSDRLHPAVSELGLCVPLGRNWWLGGGWSLMVPPWYRRSRGMTLPPDRWPLSALLWTPHACLISFSPENRGETIANKPREEGFVGISFFSFQTQWLESPFLRFLENLFLRHWRPFQWRKHNLHGVQRRTSRSPPHTPFASSVAAVPRAQTSTVWS